MRSSRRRALVALPAALALAVGVTACGDDGGTGSGGGGGGSSDLSGTVKVDGSSTVAPLSEAAAEGFQGENRGVRVTVGTSGTGGGFEKFCAGETDISDASRAIKPDEEKICKKTGIEFERGPGRQRRPRGRRQQGQRLGRVPHGRPAQEDLGQGLEGQELEGRRPELPGRGARALRPGHRLGHVRLLHRGDQRRGRPQPHRLQRQRGRQRHRPGRDRQQGRHGLLRPLLRTARTRTSSRPSRSTAATAASRRTPRRCRAATTSRSAGRCSSTRRASRLKRPEVKGFLEYYIENATEIAEQAQFVPLTDEQQSEADKKVQALSGT